MCVCVFVCVCVCVCLCVCVGVGGVGGKESTQTRGGVAETFSIKKEEKKSES